MTERDLTPETEEMNTGTTTINGIRFTDTMSSGFVRGPLHRYFINGKLVSKAVWLAAKEDARKVKK